jgi:hypothetical protein
MGMRKRWSRLITVDGVRYRYHVAPDCDDLALRICVQQVEPSGQRLLSGFRKPMNRIPVGPGHRWGQPVPHAVTPAVIRRLIVAALQRGWQPSQEGLAPLWLPGWEVVAELPSSASQGTGR